MSSLICWCHVFLGRPRRLVPGIARFITLRVTLSASRLWTCPNQRRRPLRITSSIGEMCNNASNFFVSHVVMSRHTDDLAKHPHLRDAIIPLAVDLHRLAFASIRHSRSDYVLVYFRFEPEGNLPFVQYPVNFIQLDHNACTRRSTSLSMMSSLSITDPRYLKWSTFSRSSTFNFVCKGFHLLTDVLFWPH